ncbi:MAG: DUF4388 domain-containing protein, partial [Anaerolineae bacterium]|nr:DUF4388 domain-containing protein [Anaerolineae bacterium]
GPAEEARVSFRDGKLAYAQLGSESSNLSDILQRNKKISQHQYRVLKEKAVNMNDKELGLLLVNAGYLSQEDIIGSLQQYFAGIVQRMFTWVEGFFRFDQDVLLPDGKIPVKVDLENLIIEGTRQSREWERLQEEIPSMDMCLRFTERPDINIRNLNLSVEEWRVVSFVNPKNTIRQISRATKLNELEIRRVVYSLIQAGLVEVMRPAGSGPMISPNRVVVGSGNREEQKNLVNRLIDRILSI